MKQTGQLRLWIALSSIAILISPILSLEGCSQVSISTQTNQKGEFEYDVMDKGKLNSIWREDDDTIKDSDSTELDFLYVTVFGKHDRLNVNSFKVTTNSTLSSNTTLFIEKIVDQPDDSKIYSIRINYKCNEDAAKMIKLNFKVEGNFPGCKGSHSNIFWTRKCGDNEPPRMGLTMKYDVHNRHNFTVVTDGRLADADYFSEEYDTYVLRVPSKLSYSQFFVSLNHTEDIFSHNAISSKEADALFGDDTKSKNKLDYLVGQMQYSRTQVIDRISLNYDVQILEVSLKGPLQNGGVIGEEPIPVLLSYECKRGGVAAIQLTLEISLFKNVNIFFEKECPLVAGESSFSLFSTIAFCVFIGLLVLAFVTMYNVFALDQSGVKAVPFAVSVLELFASLPIVRDSPFAHQLANLANSSSSPSIQHGARQMSQNEREFKESEFKISNISETTVDEEDQLNHSTNIQTSSNYGSL